MEPELPSQRGCFARLVPRTCGMLELGKITSGLGLTSTVFQIAVIKLTEKQAA